MRKGGYLQVISLSDALFDPDRVSLIEIRHDPFDNRRSDVAGNIRPEKISTCAGSFDPKA
jgi:hypothetical protein